MSVEDLRNALKKDYSAPTETNETQLQKHPTLFFLDNFYPTHTLSFKNQY